MAGAHEAKLSPLPDLFRSLMDQPLRPLTQARLPDRAAVYLFYQDDEPVHVGGPPHVEEMRMLAWSVQLSLSVSTARWLALADEQDRRLSELYAAQSLALSGVPPRDQGRPDGLSRGRRHQA